MWQCCCLVSVLVFTLINIKHDLHTFGESKKSCAASSDQHEDTHTNQPTVLLGTAYKRVRWTLWWNKMKGWVRRWTRKRNEICHQKAKTTDYHVISSDHLFPFQKITFHFQNRTQTNAKPTWNKRHFNFKIFIIAWDELFNSVFFIVMNVAKIITMSARFCFKCSLRISAIPESLWSQCFSKVLTSLVWKINRSVFRNESGTISILI